MDKEFQLVVFGQFIYYFSVKYPARERIWHRTCRSVNTDLRTEHDYIKVSRSIGEHLNTQHQNIWKEDERGKGELKTTKINISPHSQCAYI